MKSLIVEDDFAARRLMQIYLASFGQSDVAVNGIEAVNAFEISLKENDPYDLICLDIMMPQMDGMEALARIREIEKNHGIGGHDSVKVIMTTAKHLSSDIFSAFNSGCEAYIIKPIQKNELVKEIEKLGLLSRIQ